MDRLKIDQEGARQGELFAHSLQLGDETVTLGNIATMTIEKEAFRPWDTPANRRTLGLYLVALTLVFFVFILALAMIGFSGGSWLSAGGLLALGCCVGFLLLAGASARVALRMRKTSDFFRLKIGAADGRQIALVDDSRPTLEKIRDVIRGKIDDEDWLTTGRFDLNTDTVTLNRPGA